MAHCSAILRPCMHMLLLLTQRALLVAGDRWGSTERRAISARGGR
eukprot:COSAG01_NODE_683_length_14253_cov_33.540837_11_plen_45_part_00